MRTGVTQPHHHTEPLEDDDAAATDGPDRLATALRSRYLPSFLVFAVFVVSAVSLLVRWRTGYLPRADIAITELTVRDMNHRVVLLGPYSRFGWHHPGPMLFYLLVIPYRLLGSQSIDLNVGGALISGAALGGLVAVAGRAGGRRLAWWSALMVTIFVWALGADFLRDAWSPDVTIGAAALLVMLAWTVTNGDLWAIPVGAGVASFLVQSELGYGPMVVAVSTAALAILAVRAARQHVQLDRRQVLTAAATTAVVVGVLWALPIYQQLSHSPGNMSLIREFFDTHGSNHSLSDGWNAVYSSLGLVPQQLAARSAQLPLGDVRSWASILTLLAWVATVLIGVLRRQYVAPRLAALVAVLAVAAVWSISRVIGGIEPYLTRWIGIISPLVWIALGAALLPTLRLGSRERAGRIARAGALGLMALTLVAIAGTARANWDGPPPNPAQHAAPQRFAEKVLASLPEHPRQPVLLRVPDLEGWGMASSVALALDRAGVRFEVDDSNHLPPFDAYFTTKRTAPVVISVAFSGRAGYRRLASDRTQKLVATSTPYATGYYAAFVKQS